MKLLKSIVVSIMAMMFCLMSAGCTTGGNKLNTVATAQSFADFYVSTINSLESGKKTNLTNIEEIANTLDNRIQIGVITNSVLAQISRINYYNWHEFIGALDCFSGQTVSEIYSFSSNNNAFDYNVEKTSETTLLGKKYIVMSIAQHVNGIVTEYTIKIRKTENVYEIITPKLSYAKTGNDISAVSLGTESTYFVTVNLVNSYFKVETKLADTQLTYEFCLNASGMLLVRYNIKNYLVLETLIGSQVVGLYSNMQIGKTTNTEIKPIGFLDETFDYSTFAKLKNNNNAYEMVYIYNGRVPEDNYNNFILAIGNNEVYNTFFGS